MNQPMAAVAEDEKQMRLPHALAKRLTAYARAKGIREEEVMRRALDMLLNEQEATMTPQNEAAAPPDVEIEVPIVVAPQPKSTVRVNAEVVRIRRGAFQAIPDEVLLAPDEVVQDT